MKPTARLLSACLISALAVLVLSTSARAWPVDGLQLGDGFYAQEPIGLVPDGSGGILALRYPRALGDGDGIHVHHVNGAGTTVGAWPDSGVWLAFNANSFAVASCSDGAGGVYMAWRTPDSRTVSACVTRLASNGAAATGWTLAGKTVGTGPGSDSEPLLCPDGSGGVIVAWDRFGTAGYPLIALRLQADGTTCPGWPDTGLWVCTSPFVKFPQALVGDGQGNAIVVWRNDATFTPRALRVLGTGAVDPAWPAGGVAPNADVAITGSVTATDDGAGGAYIAWLDGRDTFLDPKSALFVSRFASTGSLAPGWPVSGLRVGLSGTDMFEGVPGLLGDGAGGVYAGWRANTGASTFAAFVQRIQGDGTAATGWSLASPVRLTDAASPRENGPALALNASGGVFAAWRDERGDGGDVYVQSLAPNGARTGGWPAAGVAACAATGVQDQVHIAADGSGAAWLAWSDARAGTSDAEAYLTRIDADGVVGSTVGVGPLAGGEGAAVRLSAARPNPSRGSATFALDLPRALPVSARVVDVRGRVVRRLLAGDVLAAGRHSVPWDGLGDDARRSAPGVYFLVVVAGGEARSAPVALVR